MTEQNRAKKVLQILSKELSLPNWTKQKRNPFETLVVTILSQNTADRNTDRAFESLSNQFKIVPEVLANAQLKEIEAAIRIAGLYKSKAKTIKQASKTIIEQYQGTLQPVLRLPLEEARKTLMQFRGVGPKTADVVLLFSANQPTLPIDTHVNRVAKRLGFAPENGDYEALRRELQALFDRADYLTVHLLLIEHGRRTCKARYPLCKKCPVNSLCPSNGKWDRP